MHRYKDWYNSELPEARFKGDVPKSCCRKKPCKVRDIPLKEVV